MGFRISWREKFEHLFSRMSLPLFLKLVIWLCQVLVAAHRILVSWCRILHAVRAPECLGSVVVAGRLCYWHVGSCFPNQALQGGFLTPGPPGKSHVTTFKQCFMFHKTPSCMLKGRWSLRLVKLFLSCCLRKLGTLLRYKKSYSLHEE